MKKTIMKNGFFPLFSFAHTASIVFVVAAMKIGSFFGTVFVKQAWPLGLFHTWGIYLLTVSEDL